MSGVVHVHIDLPGPHYEAARYAFRILLGGTDTVAVFHHAPPADLPPDAALITYSPSRTESAHPRRLLICASRRLWDHYGREASLPPFPSAHLPATALAVKPGARLHDPLVVPYVSEAAPAAVEVGPEGPSGSGRAMVTGVDLVASTFFWITRYEEGFIRERDEVGRIPQERLRVVREGLNTRPVVDEYAEVLAAWLEMLGVRVRARRPPFRVMLTHDVDGGIGVGGLGRHAEQGLRILYREAVRQRRPRTALRGFGEHVLRGLGVRDAPAVFRDIVRLDTRYGFPSFFFLMANGTHPKDARYDILGEAARGMIAAIRSTGGKVGLHVGLDAHRGSAQLRAEWERLREAEPQARPVARSHYLAFFAPSTWRQLQELGFIADSTLGFSHHVGFRAGTCRGFRPFDVERREVIPVWELPMALMDMNLFHHGQEHRYERISDTARVGAARELASGVRAHRGCLVINWHNTSYFGHHREVYRAILEGLHGAQGLTPDSVPAGDGEVIW